MLEIEASRRAPLDELAIMWLSQRSGLPSVEFCRHAAGVDAADVVVARRLGVAISTVRAWRAAGRRPS